MREIKFRAWLSGTYNKSNEQMIYSHDLREMHKFLRSYFSWTGDIKELMQYTGLNDKNGKEIYEGDIVLHKWNDGLTDKETISKVFFNNGSFQCDDGKRSDWLLSLHAINKTWASVEVIGNVYESQELL